MNQKFQTDPLVERLNLVEKENKYLKEKSSYLYDLDRYLWTSYFYYCLLLYSVMVLVSASVGPRPVYDSDVVYIIFYIYFVHLLFMKIMPTKVT